MSRPYLSSSGCLELVDARLAARDVVVLLRLWPGPRVVPIRPQRRPVRRLPRRRAEWCGLERTHHPHAAVRLERG
jgi:hypothetical protein